MVLTVMGGVGKLGFRGILGTRERRWSFGIWGPIQPSQGETSTMSKFMRRLRRFGAGDDGPTAVEYAVMLSLIVVVCLAGVRKIGNKSKTTFTQVSKSIKAAGH